MRGGDAVIHALEKEGVEYISGFAGGGEVPLWPALRASQTIKVFSARHERLGVGPFAGVGYGLSSAGRDQGTIRGVRAPRRRREEAAQMPSPHAHAASTSATGRLPSPRTCSGTAA